MRGVNAWILHRDKRLSLPLVRRYPLGPARHPKIKSAKRYVKSLAQSGVVYPSAFPQDYSFSQSLCHQSVNLRPCLQLCQHNINSDAGHLLIPNVHICSAITYYPGPFLRRWCLIKRHCPSTGLCSLRQDFPARGRPGTDNTAWGHLVDQRTSSRAGDGWKMMERRKAPWRPAWRKTR